jgi:hypothetical protein
MGSITVDVSEVARKLDPQKLEKALTSALGDAASIVREEAKRYPAAPKPSYQWTFTHKKGWEQAVKGLRAVIGTNVKYAPYLVDADKQAWMHKGRWQTTTDIVRKKTVEVKRTIEEALIRWAS